MKDDINLANIGKAPREYDDTFFWRAFRDIEMFVSKILSKGPITVSNLTADSIVAKDGITGNINGEVDLNGGIVNNGRGVVLNAPTNNYIEIGRIDGVASTPYIDFHSGATAIDFDTRLVASGGTGVTGKGVLTFYGAELRPGGTTGVTTLGSAASRWGTIYTSDLDLSNGIGDWTIVEGEDDLFIYNNKKGKTYKFALTEVNPSSAPAKKV